MFYQQGKSPQNRKKAQVNTVLRSPDYKKAVDVLVTDQTVISMANLARKYGNPEASYDFWFMRQSLAEYLSKGANVDAANHHIGAVAEAIREINKW